MPRFTSLIQAVRSATCRSPRFPAALVGSLSISVTLHLSEYVDRLSLVDDSAPEIGDLAADCFVTGSATFKRPVGRGCYLRLCSAWILPNISVHRRIDFLSGEGTSRSPVRRARLRALKTKREPRAEPHGLRDDHSRNPWPVTERWRVRARLSDLRKRQPGNATAPKSPDEGDTILRDGLCFCFAGKKPVHQLLGHFQC